jgi:hypothetical protein
VEIVAVTAAGSAGAGSVEPASVLRAYFAACRARTARRFLCCAVPLITMLLVGAQAAAGLLAHGALLHGALLAQMAISGGVAAGAAVAEWRATRTFHALIRTCRPPAPPFPN